MAGSFSHVTCVKDGRILFRGDPPIEDQSLLLDNLGDAYEAIEECFDMIEYLSASFDLRKIYEAQIYHLKKRGASDWAKNMTYEEWLARLEKKGQSP